MRSPHPSSIFHAAWATALCASVVSACGAAHTSASASAGVDAGVPDDASAADSGTNAPPTVMPYPPGPYGGAMGQVMPNFTMQGYALSRDQRDSTQLPYRDISLAEARTPECQCMAIVYAGAGHCLGSLQENVSLSPALVADPSLCAIEILGMNFDANAGRQPTGAPLDPIPATHADLDLWVQAQRQPFPVGIMTPSASNALSAVTLQATPTNFVVRASDMKIVGFFTGAISAGDMRSVCKTPTPAVEDVTTGLAPSKLAVANVPPVALGGRTVNVYVVDRDLGLFSMPSSGGAKTTVVPASAHPTNVVADLNNAYVVADATGGGVALSQIPQDGSPVVELARGGSFGGIVLDVNNVYFTRDDGVVGRVPIGGGPLQVLSQESGSPGAIVVDDKNVTFISNGEVASVPKGGGSRTTLAPAGSLVSATKHVVEPSSLAVQLDWIIVASTPAADRDGAFFKLVPGSPPVVMSSAVQPTAMWGDGIGIVLGALGGGSLSQGALGYFQPNNTNLLVTTPGTTGLNSLGFFMGVTYFTTAETAPGKRDGTLKRFNHL